MLEGKELQGELGEYGSYFVDAHDTGIVEAGLVLKVDIIKELRKLAQLTTNKLDDTAVDVIERLLKND